MGAPRGPPGTDLSVGPLGSRHRSSVEEGNPLGSGGAMEILPKGIRSGLSFFVITFY